MATPPIAAFLLDWTQAPDPVEPDDEAMGELDLSNENESIANSAV